MIQQIGYLMRTSAVYGSGKFGCANREKYCDRKPFHIPFQAEMLSVYLFRQFTIDWLNHIATKRAKQQGTQFGRCLMKKFHNIWVSAMPQVWAWRRLW